MNKILIAVSFMFFFQQYSYGRPSCNEGGKFWFFTKDAAVLGFAKTRKFSLTNTELIWCDSKGKISGLKYSNMDLSYYFEKERKFFKEEIVRRKLKISIRLKKKERGRSVLVLRQCSKKECSNNDDIKNFLNFLRDKVRERPLDSWSKEFLELAMNREASKKHQSKGLALKVDSRKKKRVKEVYKLDELIFDDIVRDRYVVDGVLVTSTKKISEKNKEEELAKLIKAMRKNLSFKEVGHYLRFMDQSISSIGFKIMVKKFGILVQQVPLRVLRQYPKSYSANPSIRVSTKDKKIINTICYQTLNDEQQFIKVKIELDFKANRFRVKLRTYAKIDSL